MPPRAAYLHQTREAGNRGPARGRLACANLAAQFLVSPGSTPILLDAMTDTGLPHLPGVATVSEILSALEAEYTELKFFPTQAAGGAKLPQVGQIHRSHRHASAPTGGISTTNAAQYWPCRTSVSIDFTGDEGLRGRRTQDCGATAEPGVVRTAS